jgi:plasmid stabilization system protein ParE
MVRFEDAISTTFERILEEPFTFPVVHRDVRRALVRTFPYGVFFRVQGDEVAVVAVMHLRRHGRAWQGRR